MAKWAAQSGSRGVALGEGRGQGCELERGDPVVPEPLRAATVLTRQFLGDWRRLTRLRADSGHLGSKKACPPGTEKDGRVVQKREGIEAARVGKASDLQPVLLQRPVPGSCGHPCCCCFCCFLLPMAPPIRLRTYRKAFQAYSKVSTALSWVGGCGRRGVWGPAGRERGSDRQRPIQGQNNDKDAENWVGGREEASLMGLV